MPSQQVPKTKRAWMEEVVAAYQDARDAIPFGALVGDKITESDLYQLAPIVCLKFRGLSPQGKELEVATDGALATYVVGTEAAPEITDHPHIGFAYCYLASHYALDLVSEETADAVLQYLAANQEDLWQRINA
jgi:hypothetical protein